MSDNEKVMYIVVNKDLKMSKGKIAAQVGHAVSILMWDLPSHHFEDWVNNSMAKVILKSDEEYMNKLISMDSLGCKIVVHDEGRTQIKPGSMTVIGYAPIQKNSLQELKNLKLL